MCVTIARWRGISMQYCQDSGKYIVTTKNTSKEYDNPLEAWNTYVTQIDIAGRRYIGNMLSKQGKTDIQAKIQKEKIMKKLVDVKTAQICLEEVPQHEIDNLARATLRAIERYFEIPENKAKYEQWLAERNANKV